MQKNQYFILTEQASSVIFTGAETLPTDITVYNDKKEGRLILFKTLL
jgi:hypothetical protein